jgi:hypothetical protein
MLNEELVNKWQPVLEHEDLPQIKDHYRKVVTAHMLEQQMNSLREQAAVQGAGSTSLLGESSAPITQTSDVQNFDPVLISLVRRTAPNLIAFDIMGVQPMSGPTGLIFALRPTYAKTGTQGSETTVGANAFYGEANTGFSASAAGNLPAWASAGNPSGANAANVMFNAVNSEGLIADRTGMSTSTAEGLGASGNDTIPSMSFSIDKSSVTAVSRALKAEYSVELAQDLKAIHGLDAETELANILTTEINAEINREIVRKVYMGCTGVAAVDGRGTANVGGGGNTGVLDGRWLVERFKALVYKIETEANAIAKNTRRGKGNFIICSSDVASALATAGVLDPTAALTVDDTGSTFAGTIGSGMKVYIDPYSYTGDDFIVVGYKGTSPYDAGMFYCPYVPLQMVRAIGEDTFQPKIGFKTRYAVGVNPFATDTGAGGFALDTNNRYYRGFAVNYLNGVTA